MIDSLIDFSPMAKSKSSELSPDLLMCKICQLPYNEPKRLPCLHSFCKACLVYHAKVNAFLTPDDDVLCLFCPLCRQVCHLVQSLRWRWLKHSNLRHVYEEYKPESKNTTHLQSANSVGHRLIFFTARRIYCMQPRYGNSVCWSVTLVIRITSVL